MPGPSCPWRRGCARLTELGEVSGNRLLDHRPLGVPVSVDEVVPLCDNLAPSYLWMSSPECVTEVGCGLANDAKLAKDCGALAVIVCFVRRPRLDQVDRLENVGHPLLLASRHSGFASANTSLRIRPRKLRGVPRSTFTPSKSSRSI